MAQILDRVDPQSQLYASMGSSIGSGLNALIQTKLGELQKKSGLSAIMPVEQAEQFSKLPDNILAKILPTQMKNMQQTKERANFLNYLMDKNQDNQPDQIGINQINPDEQAIQGMLPSQQANSQLEQIMNQIGISTPSSITSPLMKAFKPIDKQVEGQSIYQEGKYQTTQPKKQLNQPTDESKKILREVALQSLASGMTTKEAFQQGLNAQKEYNAQKYKEQKDIDQETKDIYKKTNEDYKTEYIAGNRRLNRMEDLVKKGKLDSPAWSSLLDGVEKLSFGRANLDFLRSPDSQEFKKLSTEFLKNARALFGSKITQGEIELFMKSIPTLNLTREGKLRVMRNMKIYNEATGLRKKSMDSLIQENNSRRPRDLDSLIEERVAPQLNKLGDMFKETLIDRSDKTLLDKINNLYVDYMKL
jgi:hypothetical protein